METLVIIGIERTGTNYLCSLLNHLPQVESRFELFANVAAISLGPSEIELLSQEANQSFSDKTDPALVQFMKENIPMVLSILRGQLLPKRKVLSFKVFREHLPNSEMIDLVKHHRVIFVTRRVIDTYISFMKALRTEVWINHDTTELKPTLNINHFTYWYKESLEYYTFCASQYLQWKQELPVVLRYGEFTRSSNLENLTLVARRVGLATGVQLEVPDVEFDSVFNRQDRNDTVRQKVANWDEFEQQLKKRNLYRQAFRCFLVP